MAIDVPTRRCALLQTLMAIDVPRSITMSIRALIVLHLHPYIVLIIALFVPIPSLLRQLNGRCSELTDSRSFLLGWVLPCRSNGLRSGYYRCHLTICTHHTAHGVYSWTESDSDIASYDDGIWSNFFCISCWTTY